MLKVSDLENLRRDSARYVSRIKWVVHPLYSYYPHLVIRVIWISMHPAPVKLVIVKVLIVLWKTY